VSPTSRAQLRLSIGDAIDDIDVLAYELVTLILNASSFWKSGVPQPVTGSHPVVAFHDPYGT